MIRIRKAQMTALAVPAREGFIREMIAHLRETQPARCDALGEVGLRAFIEHGITRARAHGFVSERHVNYYIKIMLNLGRDFDRDPALPAYASALADEGNDADSRLVAMLLAGAQGGG